MEPVGRLSTRRPEAGPEAQGGPEGQDPPEAQAGPEAQTAPRPSLGAAFPRLARFVLVMFRPQIYVTYGVLWTLALEGTATAVSGTAVEWTPGWGTLARALSVVLVLLFMRMLDEQKDFAYDQEHNPNRPLVTGAITVLELRTAMAVIALTVAALNVALSRTSLLMVLLSMAYGLGLAFLESAWPAAEDSILLNLVLAYPSQLMLSGYLYLSLDSTDAITADWRGAVLLALFAGAFLHFEFGRKTSWRDEPEARLYSGPLGPVGSGAATLGWALLAVVAAVALLRPWRAEGASAWTGWAPLAPVALPAYGGWLFLRRRKETWPGWTAVCFLLCLYLALVAHAALL